MAFKNDIDGLCGIFAANLIYQGVKFKFTYYHFDDFFKLYNSGPYLTINQISTGIKKDLCLLTPKIVCV